MARATMKESEITFAVYEAREGGYWAYAHGHSIFTQADSMDELRSMVDGAVDCHFETDSSPTNINLELRQDCTPNR
jgi:hypothetical protein